MKRIYYFLFAFLLIASACTEDEKLTYKTIDVYVELVYPTESSIESKNDISILASSSSGVKYESKTDEESKAKFNLPSGVYEITATHKNVHSGRLITFTGSKSNVVINETSSDLISLNLVESKLSQIVIKEIYNGGCQKDDGSGSFHYDKYIILYNNSDENAQLKDMCIAMTIPYNSTVTNADVQNGTLFYENEGWIPAGLGYFYFSNDKELKPGEQAVVVLNNANDNTLTYSNSVDLSRSEYYVTYSPEVYTNTSYHPSPSSNIPVSNYLPGFKYGTGNAWAFSNTSPALFIFYPENSSPEAFNADANNISLYNGSATQVRKKVPVDWIVDGVEVFKKGASNNSKRFTSSVDAGAVDLTAGYGYTLYRNVDKDATEALQENSGKIVYNYNLGTENLDGSTDPSGIDAEASIKNGARIIYSDTNNSSNDFHQRAKASLK
ncbi:MAG: DUF4876 domain-containing protein [Bacteroidales bacterium]|nr:DUF4876 domain-containing protein [Bacteroidales bacterium]